MSKKLKTNPYLGCKHWYLQNQAVEYNLFRLKDLQIINTTAVFLNYAANVKNAFSQAAIRANFPSCNTIKKLHELFQNLKLEIVINSSHLDNKYCYSIKYYLLKSATLKALENNHIHNIKKLLYRNKVIDFVLFQSLINCKQNQGKCSYIMLKQELCENTSCNIIAPHVFRHADKEHKHSVNMYNCFYDKDPEYDGYEIFVDESKVSNPNNNDCAYGVFYGHNNPLNCNYKVYGNKSLQMPHYKGWK